MSTKTMKQKTMTSTKRNSSKEHRVDSGIPYILSFYKTKIIIIDKRSFVNL